MARPKKPDAEKLTRRLPHIRCTEAEYELVSSRAEKAGLSLSEYVRRMALDGEVTIREEHFEFAFIHELKKIGVNINQQTRIANATGEMPPELKRLWGKLEKILDHILETI